MSLLRTSVRAIPIAARALRRDGADGPLAGDVGHSTRSCRGTFDPKLIAKYQRRFPTFDDKIEAEALAAPTLANAGQR